MLGAWTPSVLVRGVGEIASAVAVVLRRQHWVVALQQEGLPATIRRSMAFSDAVIEGDAEFMGYVARRIANRADLMTCLHDGTIPVFTCDVASVLAACRWFALVDGGTL